MTAEIAALKKTKQLPRHRGTDLESRDRPVSRDQNELLLAVHGPHRRREHDAPGGVEVMPERRG